MDQVLTGNTGREIKNKNEWITFPDADSSADNVYFLARKRIEISESQDKVGYA